MQIKRFKNYIF